MEKIRLSAPLQKESVTDGPGLRMVIWNQGCQIHCPGCHNQETWDLYGGREYPLEEILNDIRIYKNHHQGITLSGGDPFLQPKENKIITEDIFGSDADYAFDKEYTPIILVEKDGSIIDAYTSSERVIID